MHAHNRDGRAARRKSNIADPWFTSAEIGKLIVKLRWIGSNDQADTLARYLSRAAPEGFVVAPLADTD
jgi:hypothetical protein